MEKKRYNKKKFDKVERKEPTRKIRLEIYDDGLYVGTVNTDFTTSEEKQIDYETLMEYVHERFPTRKKKYLSFKIV